MYLDGYEAAPVLLNKGVSPYSNIFTGELVGIQISLEFIADVSEVENRNIHVFTDCQGAIASAFQNQIPTNKIEIFFSSSSSIERSGFFEKNVQLTSKGERDSHLLPRLKTIKSLLKTVCVEH